MEENLPKKQEVIKEALEILEKHMNPVNLGVLLSMLPLQEGSRDYLEIREELFADETLETLIAKVKAFEQAKK